MKRTRILIFSVLSSSCSGGSSNSAQSSTAVTTSTTDQSGSVTSAPNTDATLNASVPTMTTATLADTGTNATDSCPIDNCADMFASPFECNIFSQNCQPGQKCAAYAIGDNGWDATKCVDVTGTDEPGEACTSDGTYSGIDTCIEGALCWPPYSNLGTCMALCTGSWEAISCKPPATATSFGFGALCLCIVDCDPLVQNCTDPGQGCYEMGDKFSCVPDDSGEEGQANDPCEFINACDKGQICGAPTFVGAGCAEGSPGCCTPFCNFPDGTCPNPDQDCMQWLDPMQLPPNDPRLSIGACGVPS